MFSSTCFRRITLVIVGFSLSFLFLFIKVSPSNADLEIYLHRKLASADRLYTSNPNEGSPAYKIERLNYFAVSSTSANPSDSTEGELTRCFNTEGGNHYYGIKIFCGFGWRSGGLGYLPIMPSSKDEGSPGFIRLTSASGYRPLYSLSTGSDPRVPENDFLLTTDAAERDRLLGATASLPDDTQGKWRCFVTKGANIIIETSTDCILGYVR